MMIYKKINLRLFNKMMYCYCHTVVDEVSLQKLKWSSAKN